jgi:hypothetical protein
MRAIEATAAHPQNGAAFCIVPQDEVTALKSPKERCAAHIEAVVHGSHGLHFPP